MLAGTGVCGSYREDAKEKFYYLTRHNFTVQSWRLKLGLLTYQIISSAVGITSQRHWTYPLSPRRME